MRDPELITLPDFPRLVDFCGVWAMEPMAAAGLAKLVVTADWPTHLAAAASAPSTPRQTPAPASPAGEIAVVHVTGTMAKSRSSFGGTSTVDARRSIRKAVADPSVSAVRLLVDSPGDTVAGTDDLAREVRAAAAVKPVWAQVEDLTASAAYWVASQADRVFANSETALVGSIGTLMVVHDLSAAAEKEGIKTLVFATGDLKGAGAPGSVITELQQQYFRGLVADAQRSFDTAVVLGRRLTDDRLAAVRTGAVFGAREAMARGLIDGVRPTADVLAELSDRATRRTTVRAGSPLPTMRATMGETTTEATAVADIREQRAAEYDRIAGIEKVAGRHPAIVAEAIRGNWPVEKAEQAAMKADLPRGIGPANPAYAGYGRSGGGGSTGANAIAAAIMIRAGYEKAAEQAFGADTLNGLGRLRRASLVDLAAAAMQFDGKDVPATPAGLLASGGISTGSLPVGLDDAANRIAVAAYQAEPATWRSFAAIKSAPDFRQQTGVRPSFFGDLSQIPDGGDIRHGTFGEEVYNWELDQYGKVLSIGRKQFINDDLSLFSEVLPSAVKAAGRTLNSLVWRTVMANGGSFFHADHANLSTGVGSALGVAGLNAALQLVRKQRDAEGNSLGLAPAVLAVPPELELTARQLLNSQQLQRTGDQSPMGNPYQNLVELVVEPRLSNSSYTGYSTTAWYLFTGPSDVPVAVCFLDGNQTPTTKMFGFDDETDRLVITWRIVHDFGCALGDYRAATKSAGS